MTFDTEMGRPSTIEEELESLPDRVADALREWRTKEAQKRHTAAGLLMSFKAKTAELGLTMTELKAMVDHDAEYYKLCLECVTTESEYVRLNERLMAAKKAASLRTSF